MGTAVKHPVPDGLTWSGTECFKQYLLATVGVKGLTTTTTVNLQKLIYCRLKVPKTSQCDPHSIKLPAL